MKNLKVVSAFLPLLAIACFIYFSTSGFSAKETEKPGSVTNEVSKPSTDCFYQIHLDSSNPSCLSGSYTWCIDGGEVQYSSGDFEVKFPCESGTHTICVQSNTGCKGTISITVVCPCRTSNPRTIMLSTSNPACECTNS